MDCSNSQLIQNPKPLRSNWFVVSSPLERAVSIVFQWTEPEENNSIGIVSGAMLHQFPETCSIIYHPLGTSSSNSILGEVDPVVGTFTITLNVSEVNNKGDLIADCGLFTTSSQSLRADLPITPSQTDSDNDGIPIWKMIVTQHRPMNPFTEQDAPILKPIRMETES